MILEDLEPREGIRTARDGNNTPSNTVDRLVDGDGRHDRTSLGVRARCHFCLLSRNGALDQLFPRHDTGIPKH